MAKKTKKCPLQSYSDILTAKIAQFGHDIRHQMVSQHRNGIAEKWNEKVFIRVKQMVRLGL